QLVKQKEIELDNLLERQQKSMIIMQKEKKQFLVSLFNRLQIQHPKKQVEQANEKLVNLIKLQNESMTRIVDNNHSRWTNAVEKLTLLNPLQIMQRGFALPYTENGNLIRTVNQV